MKLLKENGYALQYVSVKSQKILDICTYYKKEYEKFINEGENI